MHRIELEKIIQISLTSASQKSNIESARKLLGFQKVQFTILSEHLLVLHDKYFCKALFFCLWGEGGRSFSKIASIIFCTLSLPCHCVYQKKNLEIFVKSIKMDFFKFFHFFSLYCNFDQNLWKIIENWFESWQKWIKNSKNWSKIMKICRKLNEKWTKKR